jgi:hypothetical protein
MQTVRPALILVSVAVLFAGVASATTSARTQLAITVYPQGPGRRVCCISGCGVIRWEVRCRARGGLVGFQASASPSPTTPTSTLAKDGSTSIGEAAMTVQS